jgi:hypothetical protein
LVDFAVLWVANLSSYSARGPEYLWHHFKMSQFLYLGSVISGTAWLTCLDLFPLGHLVVVYILIVAILAEDTLILVIPVLTSAATSATDFLW